MRVCRECDQQEGDTAFYASRRTNVCASCENKMRTARRVPGEQAYTTAERAQYMRSAKLKSRYGMTVEDYDAMVVQQNGKCAVCHTPPEHGRRLCVDHCHATGKVRGLLCDPCNRGLGQLKDDPSLLRALLAYLEAA